MKSVQSVARTTREPILQSRPEPWRRTLSLTLALGLTTAALPGAGYAAAPPSSAQAPAAAAPAAATPPAPPQPGGQKALTPEEEAAAQQHYQSGVAFFQAANYPAARAEFEAAYQLTHLPDFLYNLAKVAEKQARTDDEERYLKEYLATNPADASEVRARLEVIQQAKPVSYPKLPPTPALALVGAGVGALIIGIACGGASLAAANTVADPANSGKPFTAELFNTQQTGMQLNSAAIALDVIGGAALAAGGAWIGYWLYQKHKAEQRRPTPAPSTALVTKGLGIAVIGSF